MSSLSFREQTPTLINKSRQRGQIMVLAMLSIVPLSMLVAYILNGGELVASKTRIQNAVDTAVLTEASWVARSLNTMSMNNTATIQSMAIGTAGYALEGPMINAGFDTGLVHGFYMGHAAYCVKRALENVAGMPFNPLFYYYTIKSLVYIGMAIAFYFDVVKPLFELSQELPRAMHNDSESGGFSRAAEMFGRMNGLIAQDSPALTTQHVNKITAFNGLEQRETYYGFTGDSQLQLPVVEQNIMEGLESIFNNADSIGEVYESSAQIRNVFNVCNTGQHGTYVSIFDPGNNRNSFPPPQLEVDFFANFHAHGYVKGTGPTQTTHGPAAEKFSQIHGKLKSWAIGNFGRTSTSTSTVSSQDLIQSKRGGAYEGLSCDSDMEEPDEDDYEDNDAGYQAAKKAYKKNEDSCEAMEKTQEEVDSGSKNWFFDTKVEVVPNDIVERMEKIFRWSCTYRLAPYSKQKDPVAAVAEFLKLGGGGGALRLPGYLLGLPFGGKNGFHEIGKKMPNPQRSVFERGLWGNGANFAFQPGTYQTHYETFISYMVPWTENSVLDRLAPNFNVKLFAVKNGRLLPEVLEGYIPLNFLPTRNDWSLVNVGTEPRSAALMAPAFKDPTSEISAVAQSEIYNAQWYDLYTQNWRAKLTPNNLLVDSRHHDDLMSSVSKAATLNKILQLGEDELVSTH